MLDVRTLRGHLTTATTSARVVVRCLNGGRDLQDSSQRAIILLVDTLDSLYRLRIQLCCGDESDIEIGESSESNGVGVGTGGWLTDPGRMVALAETLECFCSTMKSMELYFQPGGVGVTFYRKKLLEQTFFGRLKRFKVLLLLFMQPVSNRSFLDKEIFSLKLLGEVESGPKLDTEFEERVLGISSQLASEHFITLADLCNRRLQGTGQWLFEDEEYERWLMGFSKTWCWQDLSISINHRLSSENVHLPRCGNSIHLLSR
ncbi:NACHT and Ankyrin domain protein [Aspergillus stella-maris]|uniref:NACHT and Ankyrin domain protein n=1 Tax=Aspergillus stella-maris TaxID=1810926 RepID=UPI003CCDC642